MLQNFVQKSKILIASRQTIRHLVLLLPFLLATSCSTTPKSFQDLQFGQWEARALIKDKKSSKRYIVNIDFIAEKPQFLRMEVTSTIGQHLASFAMNDKNLSWILPRDKKWFRGSVTAENVRPVLGHALDPRLIHNILFDQPIPQKSWSCVTDAKGIVVECQGGTMDMKIVWSDRSGRKRNVLIQHPNYEIQLQFHNFEKPKAIDYSIFEIARPKA